MANPYNDIMLNFASALISCKLGFLKQVHNELVLQGV